MEFMANELLKDFGNAQHLFSMYAQNGTGKAGHQIFVKDPQLLDRVMDANRATLPDGAKNTLCRPQEFLIQSLKYYCTAIFEPTVIHQITKGFWRAKLASSSFSWENTKGFIQAQLIDISLCSLLESLQSMQREAKTMCREWTGSYILLLELVKEDSGTILGCLLIYDY